MAMDAYVPFTTEFPPNRADQESTVAFMSRALSAEIVLPPRPFVGSASRSGSALRRVLADVAANERLGCVAVAYTNRGAPPRVPGGRVVSGIPLNRSLVVTGVAKLHAARDGRTWNYQKPRGWIVDAGELLDMVGGIRRDDVVLCMSEDMSERAHDAAWHTLADAAIPTYMIADRHGSFSSLWNALQHPCCVENGVDVFLWQATRWQGHRTDVACASIVPRLARQQLTLMWFGLPPVIGAVLAMRDRSADSLGHVHVVRAKEVTFYNQPQWDGPLQVPAWRIVHSEDGTRVDGPRNAEVVSHLLLDGVSWPAVAE